MCSETFSMDYVRNEGTTRGLDTQLLAVVAEGSRRRHYLPPDAVHVSAAAVIRPTDVIDVELSTHPQYMGVTNYGLKRS